MSKLIVWWEGRGVGALVRTEGGKSQFQYDPAWLEDRLLRFGAELVFSLCEHFGSEVVVINRSEETKYEEDLTRDVLEIITVFSARLYGSRSPKNRKLVQSLREAADSL